jgi:farnesyl diphosphate synthase
MSSEFDLRDYMDTCRAQVEQALEQFLPSRQTMPGRLHEAMRYATLGGGKRIRPILVYASGQAAGVALTQLDRQACAVELIHAYSLVHDDLPAMDDDDLRRGRPTCHKAFDEATAILVGDALQALAFQVLCGDHESANSHADIRLAMLETLARASGSRGMAGGQAMDLEAVGHTLNLTELESLHIHKTGALICASVRLGALANPQSEKTKLQGLEHYAKCIGLAFQIQDDILDVEGSTETLGKTQGKDEAQDKPTYTSLMGLSAAKEKAAELLEESLRSLDPFGAEAEPLRAIAGYIVGRGH